MRLPGFEGGRGVRRGAFPIICLIDLGESVWWLTGGLGGPDVICMMYSPVPLARIQNQCTSS